MGEKTSKEDRDARARQILADIFGEDALKGKPKEMSPEEEAKALKRFENLKQEVVEVLSSLLGKREGVDVAKLQFGLAKDRSRTPEEVVAAMFNVSPEMVRKIMEQR